MQSTSTPAPKAREAPSHSIRTYSGYELQLWPATPTRAITVRDIASRLAKIVYFPESPYAPFTAAQYAVELAGVLKDCGATSDAQLAGLMANAPEAYLGHVPDAARQAEKCVTGMSIVHDPRDMLVEATRLRIAGSLGLPIDRDHDHAVYMARQLLNATLERDIGACVPRCPGMEFQPLKSRIRPVRWDHAPERYERAWDELSALCGVAPWARNSGDNA